jgi:hypothetical protein
MIRSIIVAAAAVAAMVPDSAQAQSALPEALRACVALDNDAERLACFDRAVGALDARAAAAAAERARLADIRAREAAARAAAEQAEQARLAAQAAAQAKVDRFGAEAVTKGPGDPASGADLDELTAKIIAVTDAGLGLSVIDLDNGQRWRMTEADAGAVIRPGDAVRLKRGALGSYRMSLQRSGRTLRVLRVR